MKWSTPPGQTIAAVAMIVATAAACRDNKPAPDKKIENPPATPSGAQDAQTPAPIEDLADARVAPTAPSAPSLVSLAAGATIARRPKELEDQWQAVWLLDESPETGWAAPQGIIADQTIVIALPERTVLDQLIFDTAAVDGDGRAAKHVTVAISDTGPSAGFTPIAEVTLEARADGQRFKTTASIPGRWLQVHVKDNHGDPDYVELMDIRATGTQLTQTPMPSVTGTYSSDYGLFHLKQNGTSLRGCYEFREGVFDGGLDGRVMTLNWREGEMSGPAVMVFSPDVTQFTGIWWHKGDNKPAGVWNGRKTRDAAGSCRHAPGSTVAQTVSADLKRTGRSRVYGINFDTDSDQIKRASHPMLDQLVQLLKSEPTLQLSIEGHTDSTSTPQHNQQLSLSRAAAVKSYLVGAKIAATRLRVEGFGATRPVASNDTPLGRAQNRRVELVRDP